MCMLAAVVNYVHAMQFVTYNPTRQYQRNSKFRRYHSTADWLAVYISTFAVHWYPILLM